MENISCSECNRTFSMRKNYYRHAKKFHPFLVVSYKRAASNECPMCTAKYQTMAYIHHHLINDHDVNLKYEETVFTSDLKMKNLMNG